MKPNSSTFVGSSLTAGWNNAEWLQRCIICIVGVYALSINLAHLLKKIIIIISGLLCILNVYFYRIMWCKWVLKWDNVQNMSASLLRPDLGVKWSSKSKMAQTVTERHVCPAQPVTNMKKYSALRKGPGS